MSGQAEKNLKRLGLKLPKAPAPAANYVPFRRDGHYLYISGQLPIDADGNLTTGRLGDGLSVEDGQAAAKLCALNILAQANAALGGLDFVRACLKLGGFVNATPDFTDHPKVINGASDLIAEVLGEGGKHTRFAVGCASLPLGAAVEIDALIALS